MLPVNELIGAAARSRGERDLYPTQVEDPLTDMAEQSSTLSDIADLRREAVIRVAPAHTRNDKVAISFVELVSREPFELAGHPMPTA